MDFVSKIGYLVIVRFVYILGGFGGGIVNDEEEFEIILKLGF